MKDTHDLPVLLERFFTQRLMASGVRVLTPSVPIAIPFRLLLHFAQRQLHKAPSVLSLSDLQAPLIGAFSRRAAERTRQYGPQPQPASNRIRSFFRFAAYEAPAHAALIQRVLAIPNKRYEKKLVGFLTRPETTALLGTSPTSAAGLDGEIVRCCCSPFKTGLRVSEITALRREDLLLGTGAPRALPRQGA